MKRSMFTSLMALLLFSASAFGAPADSVKLQPPDSNAAVTPAGHGQVIAYYFHGDRRCATCQKLEAYSHEAIETGFADRLNDSTLVWRVINFEQADNEHFAKDYELYSQAVILSRVVDGKEVGWVNLDQIWTLVGDKEKFVAYIQAETDRFLNKTEE